ITPYITDTIASLDKKDKTRVYVVQRRYEAGGGDSGLARRSYFLHGNDTSYIYDVENDEWDSLGTFTDVIPWINRSQVNESTYIQYPNGTGRKYLDDDWLIADSSTSGVSDTAVGMNFI